MSSRPAGIVTLLTDFGQQDPYVGVMRGAVLQHHHQAVLVDLGHEVPVHDVEAGAQWLRAAIGHFPPGTVHVAVVDPGVGSERRLLAALAHGCFWLAPDNGLLTHVLAGDLGAVVRVIDPEHLGLREVSRTFHGRDVLAPVAGWLSGGRYGFNALGAKAGDVVTLAPVVGGPPRVVRVDRFGNLITSVPRAELDGVTAVVIAGVAVPLHGTYADVPVGALLALVGADGQLEIAEHLGSAASTLGVAKGAPLELQSVRDQHR